MRRIDIRPIRHSSWERVCRDRRCRRRRSGLKTEQSDVFAVGGGVMSDRTRGVYPYLPMATNAPRSVFGDQLKV